MTAVAVNTYAHSVTYVTDNMLRSVREIIRLSGLDPSNFADDWPSNNKAIKTWLGSGHLRTVVLEIYDPVTAVLAVRWDIDVVYGWNASGDGSFWVDTDILKYHIQKAGLAPKEAGYRLLLETSPGRPDVEGWGKGSYLSTARMVRQSLGSAIEHSGLGATAAYWRKV